MEFSVIVKKSIGSNYRIGIVLGGKLVPIIVSVSYRVGNWSQVSYRYHIGLKIEEEFLSVSYRPVQNLVLPIPEVRAALGFWLHMYILQ